MTISLFFLAGNRTNRLQRFGYHDDARTDSSNLLDLDLSPIIIHNQPYGSQIRTPQRTPQMTPEPMRRAKTDLSEADIKRLHLPIFERNHNARIWLDKSSSLDALDQIGNESPKSPHHNRWRHYVNVAPPRPPKHGNNPIKIEARRSNPVYVNVYSLGRRKPGDIVQTGRYCDCIVMSRMSRELGLKNHFKLDQLGASFNCDDFHCQMFNWFSKLSVNLFNLMDCLDLGHCRYIVSYCELRFY